jgi:hypothetical protein
MGRPVTIPRVDGESVRERRIVHVLRRAVFDDPLFWERRVTYNSGR